jgi:hypothetical protein
MPKQKRNTIDRIYVAVVVVVQFVNHRVTRVLEEKVDDIPGIVCIDGMGLMAGTMVDDEDAMSMFKGQSGLYWMAWMIVGRCQDYVMDVFADAAQAYRWSPRMRKVKAETTSACD